MCGAFPPDLLDAWPQKLRTCSEPIRCFPVRYISATAAFRGSKKSGGTLRYSTHATSLPTNVYEGVVVRLEQVRERGVRKVPKYVQRLDREVVVRVLERVHEDVSVHAGLPLQLGPEVRRGGVPEREEEAAPVGGLAVPAPGLADFIAAVVVGGAALGGDEQRYRNFSKDTFMLILFCNNAFFYPF